MANSSLSGIDSAAAPTPGRSGEALGPSDSSDSGSDTAGTPRSSDAGTDSAGTGERRSAGNDDDAGSEAHDIAPDRVVRIGETDSVERTDEDEDPDLAFIDQARTDALPDDDDPPGKDGPGEDEPDDDNPGDPRRDDDKPVTAWAPQAD